LWSTRRACRVQPAGNGPPESDAGIVGLIGGIIGSGKTFVPFQGRTGGRKVVLRHVS